MNHDVNKGEGSGKFQQAAQAAPGTAVQRFTLEQVTSPDVLAHEWNPTFIRNFDDENDREPLEMLQDRLANGEKFFLTRDAQGKAVGMELFQIPLDKSGNAQKLNGTVPAYIPWTAVDANLRNVGLGTEVNSAIAAKMRADYGVGITLLDIEDPDRLLENEVYGPKGSEETAEAVSNATRRLNYWARQGFFIVQDDRLPYVRPVSDREYDPENAQDVAEKESFIQSWDHMTIRFEDPALKQAVMKVNDKGQPEAINIDFVRECYVAMNLIQYDNPQENPNASLAEREAEMRHMHPAINHYLTKLDELKAQNVLYLNLRTDAVTPKRTPDAKIEIQPVAPKAEPLHRLTSPGANTLDWDQPN